jgi:hypothetical protein
VAGFQVVGPAITQAITTRSIQTVTLSPGSYQIRANAEAPGVSFTVTDSGLIDYSPSLKDFFSGRGTSMLHVKQLR